MRVMQFKVVTGDEVSAECVGRILKEYVCVLLPNIEYIGGKRGYGIYRLRFKVPGNNIITSFINKHRLIRLVKQYSKRHNSEKTFVIRLEHDSGYFKGERKD